MKFDFKKLKTVFKPVVKGARTAGSYLAKAPTQVADVAEKLAEKRRAQKDHAAAKSQLPLTVEILQQQVLALEQSLVDGQTQQTEKIAELKSFVDALDFEMAELTTSTAAKFRVLGILLAVAYVALIAIAVVLFVL